MKQIDIDAEYEKIFGRVNYPTLYDATDKEYSTFRQEIIDSPSLSFSDSKLPFESLELISDKTIITSTNPTNVILLNTKITGLDIALAVRNHGLRIITGLLAAISNNQ